MGDQVIVETAQGPEFATCTQGNHEVEDATVVKPLCAMIRMATENDRRTVEYNRKREHDAYDICEKKIADHGLDMKLVSVSVSFDGNKIIFYFTADGRVDFRELVRDLASVFRARIELRQIGVRDEAKMIGGLGICGRPFCCSQFLDGFLPVSIKMAKTQNLSLNPTKISGTCGRLMCCLKYEQNAYEDAAKRMPKVESFVQTPDGPGNVKSVDLLRQTMKVSLDSSGPSDSLKTYHNCEVCVLRNGKGSRDGIEIPERPARYVEEKEPEGRFGSSDLSSQYQFSDQEDDYDREDFGTTDSGDKNRRRHRGSRRRSGKTTPYAKSEPSAEAESSPRPKTSKPQNRPPRPQQKAEAAEGGEVKRRRPYRRNNRRWNKGEGGAPKGE
jgi:cell fate regulator YaaT (PSP1 superfamily)